MTPMLGIMASQISGHLASGAYASIATATVGSGGASSITFSSIPSTYTDLQIRAMAQGGASAAAINVNFNADTTSTAYWHLLYGTGATAAAYTISTAYIQATTLSSTANTNMFNAGVIDILDYANTNKNKTLRGLSGYDANGSGTVALYSGQWINTAAITSIVLTVNNGTNFSQYSHFALYGIKGA